MGNAARHDDTVTDIRRTADETAAAVALDALRLAGAHPIVRCFPKGALIAFDRDLRYLSAGGLGLADVGLSRANLEGRTIFDVFPPEVVATLEPLYRLALGGGESSADVHYEGRTYLQRLAPLRATDGTIVAGMGYSQDVTAERDIARALRHSEANLWSAFDHAPIGKALIDLDGQYVKVNRAMCEISGYSKQQLNHLSMDQITHPDDLAADRAGMRQLLAGQCTTYTINKRYLTADGTMVWAAKSASLVWAEDGSPLHFIAQVQDITERLHLEDALADERRRLRNAEAVGRIGAWEWDATSGIMTFSDTLYDLYGIDRDAFANDHYSALRCIEGDDQAVVVAAFRQCRSDGVPLHVRFRITRPSDGELRWFDVHGEAVHEAGRLIRIGGAVADVTEEMLAEGEAAAAARAFEQAIIRASPDIIFVYDLAARAIIWTNRSIAESLGYPIEAERADGRDLIERLIVEDDRALFIAAVDADGNGLDGEILQLDHRLRHADGRDRWFSRRTTPLCRDEHGQVTQVVGLLRDITEQVIMREQLEQAAMQDELTGIPNRRLVVGRLHQALTRSEREGEVVVLFCDLDGLKHINDTYGHHVGDAVLVETAARLSAVIRGGDTVGRLGGDEFVAICNVSPGQDSSLVATLIAARIDQAMASPFIIEEEPHRITISTGVHVAGQGDAADSVLHSADLAMYAAKSSGSIARACRERH